MIKRMGTTLLHPCCSIIVTLWWGWAAACRLAPSKMQPADLGKCQGGQAAPPPPRQVNELGRGVAATVPWETCRQQITLPGWATTLLPLCGQRSGCWELSESCSQQVLEGTVDILGCITAPLPSSLSREKGGCHAGLDNYPSLRGERSKQVCWKAQLSCWAGLGWAGLSLDLTEQL